MEIIHGKSTQNLNIFAQTFTEDLLFIAKQISMHIKQIPFPKGKLYCIWGTDPNVQRKLEFTKGSFYVLLVG